MTYGDDIIDVDYDWRLDVLIARNETIFIDLMEEFYEEHDIYDFFTMGNRWYKKCLAHSIWMATVKDF